MQRWIGDTRNIHENSPGQAHDEDDANEDHRPDKPNVLVRQYVCVIARACHGVPQLTAELQLGYHEDGTHQHHSKTQQGRHRERRQVRRDNKSRSEYNKGDQRPVGLRGDGQGEADAKAPRQTHWLSYR
ncbi:hypothetical protein RRG08_013896 [Elysia crispata]|uniref:Uncharacterized protein n=1 Tax=Elysia crispata TaxID=231223 RepID=A0AAE1DGG0_9GAST|nr:hypothetical protein RRG08_013896 [Elysia crispata]